MMLRTMLLGGVLTALLAAAAPAQESARRAPVKAAPERDFDWTGGYAGVTVGAAKSGRASDWRGRDEADRYPPLRTRVRP